MTVKSETTDRYTGLCSVGDDRVNFFDRQYPSLFHNSATMPADFFEDDGVYTIVCHLPGFKIDNISLELKGEYLVVTAEKEDDRRGLRHILKESATVRVRRFLVGKGYEPSDFSCEYNNGLFEVSFKARD